jgi:hypothetical protein
MTARLDRKDITADRDRADRSEKTDASRPTTGSVSEPAT